MRFFDVCGSLKNLFTLNNPNQHENKNERDKSIHSYVISTNSFM